MITGTTIKGDSYLHLHGRFLHAYDFRLSFCHLHQHYRCSFDFLSHVGFDNTCCFRQELLKLGEFEQAFVNVFLFLKYI